MNAITKMKSRKHRIQRGLDRAARVRKESGNAGKRLVSFSIEDMQDRADEQRMAGFSQ